jgi:hypothetical protein
MASTSSIGPFQLALAAHIASRKHLEVIPLSMTDGLPRPGTLNEVLTKLTAEEPGQPACINIFLLTYHDFATLKEVMDWLQKKYCSPNIQAEGSSLIPDRQVSCLSSREHGHEPQ